MANVDMVGRLNGVEDHAGASVVDRGADLRDLAALTVHVEGQEPARLDLRQRGGVALANILIHLLPEDDNPNERLPVFLACEEARSRTHKWDILDAAVPSVGRVQAMRATASGDLIVSLTGFEAPRILRRETPGFGNWTSQLFDSLANGTLLLATDIRGDRVLTHVAPASATDGPCGTKVPADDSLLLSSDALRGRVTLVDRQRAQRLFKDMHALACDPVHINRTCTPFAYVIDGCMERAHQMCEQLHKAGVVAGKVWLRSSGGLLAPESANCPCPDCFAGWEFHVAPVLRVRTGARDEWRVIDPSLFAANMPLPTIEEWRARQRDEQAQFFFTEARVYQKQFFFFSDPDILDPDFLCSPKTLRAYRARLAAQVAKNGPPPYCSL